MSDVVGISRMTGSNSAMEPVAVATNRVSWRLDGNGSITKRHGRPPRLPAVAGRTVW